jgi:hypothetical protein
MRARRDFAHSIICIRFKRQAVPTFKAGSSPLLIILLTVSRWRFKNSATSRTVIASFLGFLSGFISRVESCIRDPRSTKQRTIGPLLTTLEIGPWIRLPPQRHAEGHRGRYDPSFVVIMDHPTGDFARPLGLEHVGARDSRWTAVAWKRTETRFI